MSQVPLAPDLFTLPTGDGGSPTLIAGRASDGSLVFPFRERMLVAGVLEDLERVELPRRGTLWTFTTQVFRPPAPPYAGDDNAETFRPFSVGYIELPGALKVEARLTESDPDKLRIGQEMELVVEPLRTDSDGNTVMVYAFAPVKEELA